MAGNKYGKYFITECTKPKPDSWGPVASGTFSMYKVEDHFPDANVTGSAHYFYKPHVMVKDTHVHNFDEYLFFLGTNISDIDDFCAEVEFYMGEEGEVHVITAPTIVYVPAGLVHCPLKFTKLNQPVLFYHVRVPGN